MHIVFRVNATEARDLTQLTCFHHLASQLEQWVLDVVEAHLRVHALGLGGIHHLQRVRQCGRQRLFAMDMLARSDGGECHLLVHRIRCGDRHDVNRRIGDQRFPVPC